MPSRQQATFRNKHQTSNAGEEATFDFFFRQYFTALCFFANNIIHNEEEAKDIVQDCFIKLWDSEGINERLETVKSFLYTSVRNRCIDFIRKKEVRAKAALHLVKSNYDSNFEYLDEVAFAEMMRRIAHDISKLPASTQKIFELHYARGKKHSEIAAEMNSTPEAVRKQKERALKIIRQKFHQLFGLLLFL